MSEMAKDGNRTIIRDTIKPVIAQMLGVEPESLDEIIIITRGECTSCDKRNMITLLDTIADDETFAEVMSNALITRIEGDLFLCQEVAEMWGGTPARVRRCLHSCESTRIFSSHTPRSKVRSGQSMTLRLRTR